MKKFVLLMYCIFVSSIAYPQKELWGYRIFNEGEIVKAPLTGNNSDVEILHSFDPSGMLGKFPKSRLFQASNGKLYGVAAYTLHPGALIPLGVLFEYDPVQNHYRILNNSIISGLGGNLYGLIEPVPGWLYGTTDGGRSVFKYNIETEAATLVATIPAFTYNNNLQYPRFEGELMLASDGNLYGVTAMAPSSQNVPYPGGIYRVNITTGQITKVFVFGSPGAASDIMYPVFGTKLVEGSPGKLYGTALGGGNIGPGGVAPLGSGTFYEFTIATGTMVKKFDFDFTTTGCNPAPLIKVGNKIYGALSGLSLNPENYPNAEGSLYEFNLDTQTLSLLHSFNYFPDDQVMSPYGLLLYGSDGNLYGSSLHGNFKFDMAANTVTRIIHSQSPATSQPLIEICRKPSYPFFDTATFVVCENEPFSFDIQNTNATVYVWRKGSVILPEQTTAVLHIENATPNDTGIYTCTMTNECGTTVTMPIQLTVEECMGIDDEALAENAVMLYPNPVSGILNLELKNENFEVQEISIVNMLGQTVYKGNDETLRIDVGFLNSGMYQVTVNTDKGAWIGKFIKE
jgi:hypothetical protein